MGMTDRENYIRNASFQGHEWIPCTVVISGATWNKAPDEWDRVCAKHPRIFPNHKPGRRPPVNYEQEHQRREWTDPWGCQWEAELDGLDGVVVESPLSDWANFESYQPPEFQGLDEKARERLQAARDAGQPAQGDLGHGFFFMRLYYLRGFNEFMMDVAAGEPKLDELIEMVVQFNEQRIAAYLDAGVDVINGGDDMGTQTASMIGEKHFRRYLQPGYSRMFKPARDAGKHVYFHADGYLMDLVDPILESGVSILNPQDLVNGIDALAEHLKGRACIALDVDRQTVLPFGKPAEIRELIREEVMTLGSPEGGLQFIAGIYPPTPPENVDALCSAMEEFSTWWVGK